MLKSVNAETPRTLSQTVFGTRYIDEPVCRDRNTDGDPNCLDSGGSERYYYHQDINFRVVALSDESGAVVERYEYTAYGEPRVYAGGAGESGCLLSGSTVGNPHMHQGLRLDDESGLYENRFRMYHARLGRFSQRDPAGYVGSLGLYEYVVSRPLVASDPLGLCDDPMADHDVEELTRRNYVDNVRNKINAGAEGAGGVIEAGVTVCGAAACILVPDPTDAALVAALAARGLRIVKVGEKWVLQRKTWWWWWKTTDDARDLEKAKDAVEAARKAAIDAWDALDSAQRKLLNEWMAVGAEGAGKAIGKSLPSNIDLKTLETYREVIVTNIAKQGTNDVFSARLQAIDWAISQYSKP